MTKKGQESVLRVLKKSAEPLSFKEILSQIKPEVSASTLKRYLQSLKKSGQIKQLGLSKSTVYQESLSSVDPVAKSQEYTMMTPEPVIPKDLPEFDTFANYRPYLEKYFSYEARDKSFYNRSLKSYQNISFQ